MQNDMRDRLVELLSGKSIDTPVDVEYVADCILEDGWIRPPCKVGETIYSISINRDIEEYVVSGVCLYPNGWFVEFYYEDKPYSIHIDDVFLTKDQAEQKLKELRENG